MSNLYANIIVNISHEALDRTFQYIIPDSLINVIEVGSFVQIPFGKGNKLINGYVLEITEKAEFDPLKQKEIVKLESDPFVTESKLIKIAYFMKKRYGSTMINALKTVLPIKQKVKEKNERTIELIISQEEAKEKLEFYEKKHQTARYRLLKELIENNQLDYTLVIQKLEISKKTIDILKEQGILSVNTRRIYRNSVNGKASVEKKILNEKQQEIADSIISDYRALTDNSNCKNVSEEKSNNIHLIRGVTGSGKTEIYMEVIDEVIKSGRQAIVLIPEIALTYQTVMRFYKRYGDRVSTLHSKLSKGEKYDQFVRAKNGEIDVMIGPRSALFTPFENLGIIVIDEEHESSYKSDSMPKYHAREVAEEIAKLNNAMLVLGSATPSLVSYYRSEKKEIRLHEIDYRANNATLADVKVVDLREELKSGNKSMFSRELTKKIEDRLLKNEQVMLFLNRRGLSSFVSCRSCGYVVKCPHCDVSLTEHKRMKMVCHYCGYTTEKVKNCPECNSSYIGGIKAGTEQVEDIVKKLFPNASVLRMDADTTKDKDSYERILSSFANKEADILVGTQMIVKGHDFPSVTLVGVLLADMSLHANDYRASERTFELITQAVGRAGRGDKKGEAIIQTYSPDDYCIVHAAKQDYKSFYEDEIAYRELLQYPPAGHLLSILLECSDDKYLLRFSENLAEGLKNDIINRLNSNEISVIGPTDASISKINDIYRKVIYLKANNIANLIEEKDVTEQHTKDLTKVRVTFDMDPVNGY